MNVESVVTYIDHGSRNFRYAKPVGRSDVRLYCNSCGQHCETVGKLNDRIPCTKTDGILPTWRDVDLRAFFEESHGYTKKTQSAQKKVCRICERPFMSYNNRHSCDYCRDVVKGANIFKTECYTGILYDADWLPVCHVFRMRGDEIVGLIEERAESLGIELRYRVFCGIERVAKYGKC
jgi:hypothetical protein